MSERDFPKKEVYIAAGALAATALGTVALTLIRRHHENGDTVTLEGEPSDEPVVADEAYISLDDDPERFIGVESIDVVGEASRFRALHNRVVNGAVIITNKMKGSKS